LNWQNSNAFNLTEDAEDVSHAFLSFLLIFVAKALNKEIALLLRVLEALLLTENLSSSLQSWESGLNIKLKTIKLLLVKVGYSPISACRTI
jgi:hypothetical protein